MLTPNDCIMVDIDGNAVPCVVLSVEGELVKLSDTGSGRTFWRTIESLETSKRFDGIVSYQNYPDYLRSARPDITVKFLPGPDARPDKPKKERDSRIRRLTATEEESLLQILARRGMLDNSQRDDD